MNTILKNPTLGRKMVEAWDSPVGSTKRTQMGSIISSLQKTASNKFDGAGGPGGIGGDTSGPLDPYVQHMTSPSNGTGLASVNMMKPAPQGSFIEANPDTYVSKTPDGGTIPGAGLNAYNSVADSIVTGIDSLKLPGNQGNSNVENKAYAIKQYADPKKLLSTAEINSMNEYLSYIKEQSNKNIWFGRPDANIKKPSDFGMSKQMDVVVSGASDPHSLHEVQSLLENHFYEEGARRYEEDVQAKQKIADAQAKGISDTSNNPAGNSLAASPYAKYGPLPTSSSPRNTKTPAGTQPSFKTVDEALDTLKPGGVGLLPNNKYVYVNINGTLHIGKQGDNYRDPQTPKAAPAQQTTPTFKTADEAITTLKPGGLGLIGNGKYVYVNIDGSYHVGKQGDNYKDPQTPIQTDPSQQQGATSQVGAENAPTGQTGANTGTVAGDTTGNTTGTAGTAGTTSTMPAEYANLAGYVNAGMSDEQIAAQYMNDKKALSALIPGNDDWAGGASAQGHKDAVEQKLRETSNLDNLLNQKKNLAIRSGSFMRDITDYIDQKDTYVRDIDKMYDDAYAKINSSGIPLYKEEGAAYLNFLTMLKGRQNERYTDMLNNSVQQFQTEQTNLDNQITDKTNQLQNDINSGQGMEMEHFNRIHDTLINLADQIRKAPQAAMDAAKAQIEIDKARAESISAQIKSAKDYQDLTGSGGVDSAKFNQQMKGIDDLQFISDKDGNLKPGGLDNFYQQLQAQGNSELVTRAAIAKAMKTKADTLAAAGDLNGFNSLKNQIISLQQAANASTDETTKANYSQDARDMLNGVASVASGVYKNYVKSNAVNIKGALEELTGSGGWFHGGAYDPWNSDDKAKFFKNYSGKIDTTLLNTIWNTYQQNYNNVKDNPSVIFLKNEKPGHEKIQDISPDDLATILSNHSTSIWQTELNSGTALQ